MIVILLILGFLTLLYFYAFKKPFDHKNYWAKKNVPFFGDSVFRFLGREIYSEEFTQKMNNQLSNTRYIGAHRMKQPILIVKSPELLRQMFVKDFDHFLNHQNSFPSNDELWSRNLLVLKGQTWKNMRSTLSPSFTSSKMKLMFHLICQNAELFVNHFLKKNDEIIEEEFKDVYTRFTNDIIASAAFGVTVNSLEDRNNEFFEMGSSVSIPTKKMKLVYLLNLISPKITSFLRLSVLDKKVSNFFMNLVKDSIKMRKENNINRTDMLGLLMEARDGIERDNTANEIKDTSFAAVEEHLEMKKMGKDLTDKDIASQAFIFFAAGFDTVSRALCFMAQELAENPDIQKRLAEEIDEHRPKKGAPSYETIMKLTYMDMVVSETLRKWPPTNGTDRVVTKPYTIQPELPDEKPVHLNVGEVIVIPFHTIHHDPNIYENPEKFDPERFSPENKKNIKPYTYMPFGVGPRNCIGSRFALLEIKALFFYILSHFEIVPIKETKIPYRVATQGVSLSAENDFPLGLKRRK